MECGATECHRDADLTVFWPGSDPIVMCGICAWGAATVASVMGFNLPVGSLAIAAEPVAKEVEQALSPGLCLSCLHGATIPSECPECGP